MKASITKEKLGWWGHALVHPFDGFYEIRFRNQGSLLLAFLLLIAFGVMRGLSAQYTGFVMNLTNQDELATLSLERLTTILGHSGNAKQLHDFLHTAYADLVSKGRVRK